MESAIPSCFHIAIKLLMSAQLDARAHAQPITHIRTVSKQARPYERRVRSTTSGSIES
jgi:hypothetical protein